ncbi:MAG: outer membrane beta-barrel protein [Saprospiraceae bacterium]|jgi:hypothetical protein|nr:outer membrane beta-barrel protein [Saprospiraceae bacterium]
MRTHIVLFFLICYTHFSNAQSSFQEGQLRIGLVKAKLVNSVDAKYDGINKYCIGFYLERRNADKPLSILTGLEVIGKGSNVLYGERVNFQYLSVRISPQWNYKNIFFSTGIYVSYLSSIESNVPSASRFIIIEDVKKLDFGICLGPGYRLFQFLNIGLLYDIGLNNMYMTKTYGANGSFAKVNYRNRNWLLYIGAAYRF